MHRSRVNNENHRLLSLAVVLLLVGSIFSVTLSSTILQPSFADVDNIVLETDKITYRPDFDVVIEGSIVDPLTGEDQVTITVETATGSNDLDNDITLTSQDQFDVVYSIDSGADEGIYTVQAEYGSDTRFTYFIVDQDDDTVSVDTDASSYNGGDDVVVTGVVDHIVTGEDVVEITIFDPNNDEILNSQDVTLGEGSGVDNDEYKYTFTNLDTDATPGRYAVLVEYADNQEGSAIFTVEDTSGDPITASLDKTGYKPGDKVTITGDIATVVSSRNLEIVIENSTNDEIDSDLDVTVASNGNFEFETTLDDQADEGEYTVTISYGSDDLELTFDVSESGGGTTTPSLTVKIPKFTFLAGESMIVTGTVPKIVKDEDVNILVYNNASMFVGIAAYVPPNSDKTYSATLKLKSDLKAEGGYQVRVNYDGEEVVAKFTITGQLTGADVLTVQTDKAKYEVDSTVQISGKVASSSVVAGEKVLVQVYNPEQAAYRFDQVTVQSDGSYSYSMVVGGKLGIGGTYDVKATYLGKQVKTTFELAGGKSSFNLMAGGKSYPILYEITDGQIKNMFVNENEKKLVISIEALENGNVTLVLPRAVIDSIENGKDAQYLVATTDLDAGASGNPTISESETTPDARTIVIGYAKGTDLIEISGTTIVPEFGALSVLIFAVAIIAILFAAARFRSKLGNSGGSSFTGLSGQ